MRNKIAYINENKDFRQDLANLLENKNYDPKYDSTQSLNKHESIFGNTLDPQTAKDLDNYIHNIVNDINYLYRDFINKEVSQILHTLIESYQINQSAPINYNEPKEVRLGDVISGVYKAIDNKYRSFLIIENASVDYSIITSRNLIIDAIANCINDLFDSQLYGCTISMENKYNEEQNYLSLKIISKEYVNKSFIDYHIHVLKNAMDINSNEVCYKNEKYNFIIELKFKLHEKQSS